MDFITFAPLHVFKIKITKGKKTPNLDTKREKNTL